METSRANFPIIKAIFKTSFRINLLSLRSICQKRDENRKSGCGEIGRRTRLRIWRREAWGFESLHPHRKKRSGLSCVFF